MTESKFNPGPAAAAAAPVARPILVFESRPRVALWHGLVCAMRRGPTGPEPKHPGPGLGPGWPRRGCRRIPTSRWPGRRRQLRLRAGGCRFGVAVE